MRIASMFIAVTLTLATAAASAQDPQPAEASSPLLAPSTRSAAIFGGLGFSAGDGGAGFNLLVGGSFHLGEPAAGPVLGGEIQLNLGSGTAFLFGGRFGWDIPIADLPFFITPSVRLGGEIFPGQQGAPTLFLVDIQPAVDVKLVLSDRVLLWARPVGIDILIGEFSGAAYQFLIGAGATL